MAGAEESVNTTKDEEVVVTDGDRGASSSGEGGNASRLVQASGQPANEPLVAAPAQEVSGSTRTLMFHIDEIEVA